MSNLQVISLNDADIKDYPSEDYPLREFTNNRLGKGLYAYNNNF